MARALVLTAGGVTGAPERSDGILFLANPMGLVARRELLERGLFRGRAAFAAGQPALEAA